MLLESHVVGESHGGATEGGEVLLLLLLSLEDFDDVAGILDGRSVRGDEGLKKIGKGVANSDEFDEVVGVVEDDSPGLFSVFNAEDLFVLQSKVVLIENGDDHLLNLLLRHFVFNGGNLEEKLSLMFFELLVHFLLSVVAVDILDEVLVYLFEIDVVHEVLRLLEGVESQGNDVFS